MRKLVELNILPGIFTESTARGSEPRWKSGNNVRFRYGLAEKIGGWVKLSGGAFTGMCRGLFNWITLDSEYYVAVGTHSKLQLWSGASYYNITPARDSGTLGADPFDTTDTDNTVTVTDAAHGLNVGDYVTFSGATAVGGLDMNGTWTVATVPTAGTYTFEHTSAASATATGGGGAVAYVYEISPGEEDTGVAGGWGAGPWGSPRNPPTNTIGWGQPYTGSATGIPVEARVWSLDKFGEDLIANYRGGPIYHWDASAGTSSRATEIAAAPNAANAIIVSPEDRHLIALGAHDGSDLDPLLVAWCDQENFNAWTPTATNTAGDKRLDSGNTIMQGVRANGQIVILTDLSAYSMYFSGSPYTYNFKPLGEACGTVSPHGAVEHNGVVAWWGEDDFFIYDGVVRVLPCDVHDHVFGNYNRYQRIKVSGGINQDFTEAIWVYPSAESSENDSAVGYNLIDGTWFIPDFERTAWVDQRAGISNPIAAGVDGYLYAHETGVNADGAAMTASLESYDFEIGQGDKLMHVSKIIPDMVRLTGALNLTLRGRRYSQSDQNTKGPFSVLASTPKISTRLRARQVSVALESDQIGDDWRLGTIRLEITQHGGQ